MAWLDLSAEVEAEFSALPRFVRTSGYGVRTPRAAYDPQDYRQRKAIGQCSRCRARARLGRTTCARHVSGNRPGRYARNVKAGRCGTCGARPFAIGRTRCDLCIGTDNARKRVSRETSILA